MDRAADIEACSISALENRYRSNGSLTLDPAEQIFAARMRDAPVRACDPHYVQALAGINVPRA